MNSKLIYILISAVVVLIGINLFMLFGKSNKGGFPPHGHNPAANIGAELNFDEEQMQALNKEFEFHPQMVEAEFDQINSLKEEMYGLVQSQGEAAKADSLSEEIAKHVKQIEWLFYNHFNRIRGMCKEEQLDNFNAWMDRVKSKPGPGMRRGGPPGPPPHMR